jgi:hypothetical protein
MAPVPDLLTKADTPAKVEEIPVPFEEHFSIAELAARWDIGASTLRRMLADEPGLIRFGESRIRRNRQRPHVSIRVPLSVAQRFYRRITQQKP